MNEPVSEGGAPFATVSKSPNRRWGRSASPDSQAWAVDAAASEGLTFVGIDVSEDRLHVHLRPSAESFAVALDGQGLEQRVVRLLTAGPALVRAGVDIDQALADVRERVDLAKSDLPDDTDEPIVNEVNLALFPVLVVTLSGDLPERALLALARHLEDRIEALTNVLDVEIAGDREELLEVVIDPLLVQSYGRQLDELLAAVSRNNRLVAAGALDTRRARFAVKVPGVFETPADVLNSRSRSSATSAPAQ